MGLTLLVSVVLFDLAQDIPFREVHRCPWLSAGLFVAPLLTRPATTMSFNAGASRCPAAACSVFFNVSFVFSGYAVQVLYFGEVPSLGTALGVSCLLVSVILMAVAQDRQTKAAKATAAQVEAAQRSEEH